MADYKFNPDKWRAAGGTIDDAGIAWSTGGLGKSADGKSYFRGPNGEAIPMQTTRTGKFSGIMVDPAQARSLGYDPAEANKALQSTYGAFDKVPDLGNKLGMAALIAGTAIAGGQAFAAGGFGGGASGLSAGAGAESGITGATFPVALGGGFGGVTTAGGIAGQLGGALPAVLGGIGGAGAGVGTSLFSQLGGVAKDYAVDKLKGYAGDYIGQAIGNLLAPKAPGAAQQPVGSGAYPGVNIPSTGFVGGPGMSAFAPITPSMFQPMQAPVGGVNPFEAMRQRLRTGQGPYTLSNYAPGDLATPPPQKII